MKQDQVGKRIIVRMLVAVALTVIWLASAADIPGQPVLPLKVSGNGRYLVDQQNRPFLVLGDTAWSLIVQP